MDIKNDVIGNTIKYYRGTDFRGCRVIFCLREIYFRDGETYMSTRYTPVGKIAKKQSEGVCFCKFGTKSTVPYCQKYTPTDCFSARSSEIARDVS